MRQACRTGRFESGRKLFDALARVAMYALGMRHLHISDVNIEVKVLRPRNSSNYIVPHWQWSPIGEEVTV